MMKKTVFLACFTPAPKALISLTENQSQNFSPKS